MQKTCSFISILISIIFFCGCKKTYDSEIISIMKKMDIDAKIGQLMMFAVPGSRMNPETASLIEKYRPGGVLLFGYNVADSKTLKKYISDMQNDAIKSCGVPLFVSIDQEGGRVIRITEGVTQFPGSMAAGSAADRKLAYKWGRILGIQLRLIGVNINLAPVLDVNNNPENPVINTRSIGSDPGIVSEIGSGYIRGLQESLCIAVGKHFPGHGDTNKDSHKTLPVIEYGMGRLERVELFPFKKAIDEDVGGIMTAHISYPVILKSGEPATMSDFFINGVLRGNMKFNGIVMTDAMEMDAISKRYDLGEASLSVLKAGGDIILLSSYGHYVPLIVNRLKKAVRNGELPESRIDESVKRILDLKLRYGIIEMKNGSAILAGYQPGKIGDRILSESEKVNRELSRKSISFIGDENLIRPSGRIRIFVSGDRVFFQNLNLDESNLYYENITRKQLLDIKTSLKKNIVVYYYPEYDDLQSVARMKQVCDGGAADLVVLFSGNPFPLVKSGLAANMVISFSNTVESIRQMAECLNGAFVPKKGSTIDLGSTK